MYSRCIGTVFVVSQHYMMSQSAYTCITCHVAFTSAEVQRRHYKSDWHRYNLKRKVVSLPPISVEDFQEKVAAQQALVANKQSEQQVIGVACKICQRKFNSYNSYMNHLNSKKHKEAEKRELLTLEKKLKETTQAHVEKSLCGDAHEIAEKCAIKKAMAEAKTNLLQPTVLLKSDDIKNPPKPSDNPRLRWYKKQMKAMKETSKKEETSVVDDDDDDDDSDDWEELSDDDKTLDEESEFDVESQTDSNFTETSSLAGVMSRIKLDSDADVESLVSEQGTEQRLLGVSECLFCSKKSLNIECNVSHMSSVHGFFIPELPYLTDLDGLLTYLGEKVGVGNVCLWCNERGHAFYSLKAVRTHMKDKGHCKMFTEGDAAMEYADFYDFRSSYPDYDSEDDSDDTMEDVAEAENVSENHSEEDMELVLPSGARIGHRSLMRYYRQNFPTIERFNLRTRRRPRLDRLIAQYKAIGWHEATASVAIKKQQKDMKFLQNMKAKYMQKLGGKNNKTMMKHYRPQVVF